MSRTLENFSWSIENIITASEYLHSSKKQLKLHSEEGNLILSIRNGKMNRHLPAKNTNQNYIKLFCGNKFLRVGIPRVPGAFRVDVNPSRIRLVLCEDLIKRQYRFQDCIDVVPSKPSTCSYMHVLVHPHFPARLLRVCYEGEYKYCRLGTMSFNLERNDLY